MDLFIPDMYYQNIYKINYKKLKKNGIKCLVFDLDNTLVPYSDTVPDNKVKELFSMLDSSFKLIILSNASKDRLRPFKEILNVDTAYRSKKPLKRKYKKIMKLYKFKANEIACIGDQLITDIFGANRVGMMSILVNSISLEEPFYTKFNRFFERKIIKKLNKRQILFKGEYYE